MTPLQMIRDECSNHQPDGSCLGAKINHDLSIPFVHLRPRCLVAECQRCPFFEENVAPMANSVTDKRKAASLRDAVLLYHMAMTKAQAAGRAAARTTPSVSGCSSRSSATPSARRACSASSTPPASPPGTRSNANACSAAG